MALHFEYAENHGKKKSKIICLENGYHGDTIGAMSVSARDTFTLPFKNYLFEVHFIPAPTEEHHNEALDKLKASNVDGEALAFIYEPLVQGAGGMLTYPAQYLESLVSYCQENDIITIADEVMTGFGRTGSLFASLQHETSPDILCLSKGITGGFLPLGATTCSEKIFHSFSKSDRKNFFFHGHSYTGNPLACAAGVASFDILMEEKCLKRIGEISEKNQIAKEELASHPRLTNVRSVGTMFAADIGTEEDTNYLNPVRDRLYAFFLGKGFILRPLGNVAYLLPPYCITDEELDSCYRVIKEAAESAL